MFEDLILKVAEILHDLAVLAQKAADVLLNGIPGGAG